MKLTGLRVLGLVCALGACGTKTEVSVEGAAPITTLCIPTKDLCGDVDPGWLAPPHTTYDSDYDSYADIGPLATSNVGDSTQEPEDSTIWTTGGISIGGANVEIVGPVTSGTSLTVSGSRISMTGPVEFGTVASVNGTGNSISPPIQRSRPAPPSIQNVATWRPGTPEAVRLGVDYEDRSSSCSGSANNRTWTITTPLARKVYFANCDIVITGAQRSIEASFVSEGSIKVTGAGLDLKCATSDYFVFVSNRSIQLNGANLNVRCGIYASETINVTGANAKLRSQIAASSVSITGAGTVIG